MENTINVTYEDLGIENESDFRNYFNASNFIINPVTGKKDYIKRIYAKTFDELLSKINTQKDLVDMVNDYIGYGMPKFFKVESQDNKQSIYYVEYTKINNIVILETEDSEDYVWIEGSNPIVFVYLKDGEDAVQTPHLDFESLINYINIKRGVIKNG